jgi:hypothetical protein
MIRLFNLLQYNLYRISPNVGEFVFFKCLFSDKKGVPLFSGP